MKGLVDNEFAQTSIQTQEVETDTASKLVTQTDVCSNFCTLAFVKHLSGTKRPALMPDDTSSSRDSSDTQHIDAGRMQCQSVEHSSGP